MGALRTTTPPAIEPVTLAEAKAAARIDVGLTIEDLFITSLIPVARRLIETASTRRLITQTVTWNLNDWPRKSFLLLPVNPVQEVVSIKFTNQDGVTTTLPAADFIVDTFGEPARVVLKEGIFWPIDTPNLVEANAIEVIIKAGFGDVASDIPDEIITAIKLTIAHYFENRESTIPTAARIEDLPQGVRHLLTDYAQWNAFAHARIDQEGL